MKGKKSIKATNQGQEYAHQYQLNNPNEYQYQNETKRVKYRVDSDVADKKNIEENYSVQPELINNNAPQGIRVKKTKEDVMLENVQRSYKIKHKPPVRSGTDPGSESYLLPNNPREDELHHIQKGIEQFEQQLLDERNTDLSNPGQRNKIVMEEKVVEPTGDFCFLVGEPVQHIEEGIDGEVSFNNGTRITVIWADKTRERFTVAEAQQYLKKVSYVDTAQSLVDPLNTPPAQKHEPSEASKKAIQVVDGEEQEEIDNQDLDIEKLKLKRKVGELEKKINQKDIDDVKEKAARELVDLMLKKGMIQQDEEVIEKQVSTIVEMDDFGYEALKNVVLSTKSSSNIDDVLAVLNDDEEDDDIIEDGREYARMKEEMKKQSAPTRTVDGIEMGDTSFFENGGLKNFKPRVGGFGKDDASDVVQTRNLSASQNKQPKPIEKKSNFDLSGFQDLQGLKAPINIPAKEHTAGTKYADLLKDLNWTTTTKSF